MLQCQIRTTETVSGYEKPSASGCYGPRDQHLRPSSSGAHHRSPDPPPSADLNRGKSSAYSPPTLAPPRKRLHDVDLAHYTIYTRSMSPRLDPEPSSPLLPFDDTADSPGNASRAPRPPTAFISYSHEAPEHNDRVLDLANRLRTQGVDCEIDKYQVSPPEGWPLWMQRQVQKSDFVIVVCTDTYSRRCIGNEEPGKGTRCRLGKPVHPPDPV